MSLKRTLLAALLMILTAACLRFLNHEQKMPPNKALSTFPEQIGEWIGEQQRFSANIYEILGVDDSFLGTYRNTDGRQVQLYIGFYQSQREGDLIHSPKQCLPGSGWNIVRTTQEELRLNNIKTDKIKMIKLILRKGTQKQVVFYWFQSRGRYIASEYMQKLYLVFDSVTRHRTDGAFVRLISPVIDGDEEKTSEHLRDFTQLLLPELDDYIPS